MIDVVIPFRGSPATKNLELKYALRSLEKNVSNVGRVIIIGDWIPVYLAPDMITYVAHTERNWFHHLTKNIHDKLHKACTHPFEPAISQQFLYMNDDHFITSPFDAAAFPYFHQGDRWVGKGVYNHTMNDTITLFGHPLNNFDMHCPMLIDKDKYTNTVSTLKWKKDYGYCIKTAYCYMNGITGEYYPDLKIDGPMPDIDVQIYNRHFFSVGDKGMTPAMRDKLQQLFPNKSKYEL